MHRRFCIGPPEVSLHLLTQKFHRRGILLIIAFMKEKQHILNRTAPATPGLLTRWGGPQEDHNLLSY